MSPEEDEERSFKRGPSWSEHMRMKVQAGNKEKDLPHHLPMQAKLGWDQAWDGVSMSVMEETGELLKKCEDR